MYICISINIIDTSTPHTHRRQTRHTHTHTCIHMPMRIVDCRFFLPFQSHIMHACLQACCAIRNTIQLCLRKFVWCVLCVSLAFVMMCKRRSDSCFEAPCLFSFPSCCFLVCFVWNGIHQAAASLRCFLVCFV